MVGAEQTQSVKCRDSSGEALDQETAA